MSLFRSGTEKEIDAIIQRLHMNMSNNDYSKQSSVTCEHISS